MPKDSGEISSFDPASAAPRRSPVVPVPNEGPQDLATSLGSQLVDGGVIDAAALDRARRAAAKTGERFDHVLTKLGIVSEASLLDALSLHLGIPLARNADLPTSQVLAEKIRTKFIKSKRVLPLTADALHLTVAVVDPFDREPIEALAYLTDRRVEIRLISEEAFATAVQNLYGEQQIEHDARRDDASEWDVQRLRDIANEAPVIRLVNQLIAEAVDAKASDIHIEPGIDGVAVRYRIDGQLRKVQMLPAGLRAAVTSRIKIMAKLDIAERRLPQDGRIKAPVRGIDVDFRISTVPAAHGESIVIRILDRSQVLLDFARLGFSDDLISALEPLTDQPNGIFLVTGPTGSGKTTTLYAALKRVSKPNVKILTVEDPIEYQMEGINQIQVHPAIGLDFPHALRSILRQDPDIIMIGEIRDLETARIAIQAALTGHLVFSTLHTNSAVSTITRLVDMGVENYLLTSTINGVLAQRLVRRLCPDCATPHRQARDWLRRISSELAGHPICREAKILAPAGCTACGDTGFSGRIAIAELLLMDDTKRASILAGAAEAEIEAMARRGGMQTMYHNGLENVCRGQTTVEEVLRVTRMA
jgi:general secretion pathway protein E